MLAAITAAALIASVVFALALLTLMVVRDQRLYGGLAILSLSSVTAVLTFAHLTVTGF